MLRPKVSHRLTQDLKMRHGSGLLHAINAIDILTMSPASNVPEPSPSSSLTGSGVHYKQQSGQPGFITADGNPFSQEQQPANGQRTPPTTTRITSTFTYSPFAKDQQQWRGPLAVSGGSRHSEELFTRPTGEDILHAVGGGRADGRPFWYTGAKSGNLSDLKVASTHTAGLYSSPSSSQPRPASRLTLDFDPSDTSVTPFSPPDPRCRKALEPQASPHIAFSTPLQWRSTIPAIPVQQGFSELSKPLGDSTDNDTAAFLARFAAADGNVASVKAELRAALITNTAIGRRKPEQARDLRGRWASSPSTKATTASDRVQKPVAPTKNNNGGRGRCKRTQTELLMEAGIRFGYLDVPNVSVVTGGPLVPGLAQRRRGRDEGGYEEDEAKVRARGIYDQIWERRRVKALVG